MKHNIFSTRLERTQIWKKFLEEKYIFLNFSCLPDYIFGEKKQIIMYFKLHYE